MRSVAQGEPLKGERGMNVGIVIAGTWDFCRDSIHQALNLRKKQACEGHRGRDSESRSRSVPGRAGGLREMGVSHTSRFRAYGIGFAA